MRIKTAGIESGRFLPAERLGTFLKDNMVLRKYIWYNEYVQTAEEHGMPVLTPVCTQTG